MRALLLLIVAAMLCGCSAAGRNCASDREFPEKVTLYMEQAGEIITLDTTDYIIGCLFASVSPAYAEEAVNAAAAVISGNVLYLYDSGEKHLGADFIDSQPQYMTPEQAMAQYPDKYSVYLGRFSGAAEYGMAHILLYEDDPVYAPFCTISTGKTEQSDCPWLPSRELEADRDSDEALSSSVFSQGQLQRTLVEISGAAELPAERSEWFSQAEYTSGGTLRSIRFGDAVLTGEQLRQALGLRSAAIAVEYSEERFVFRVRGIGGNLGMSLN
ncbi:MAG: hypothetical protein ACI4KA_04170, partial [Oscillospiraceae bacterium]